MHEYYGTSKFEDLKKDQTFIERRKAWGNKRIYQSKIPVLLSAILSSPCFLCTWQYVALEGEVLTLLDVQPGVAYGDYVWHDLDPRPALQPTPLHHYTTPAHSGHNVRITAQGQPYPKNAQGSTIWSVNETSLTPPPPK